MNSPTEVIRKTFHRCSITAPFARLHFARHPSQVACKRSKALQWGMAIEAFADLTVRRQSALSPGRALGVAGDARRRPRQTPLRGVPGVAGVATNVLSQRLATLIEEGIVERRPYSEHPDASSTASPRRAAT